jgi:hypothetical protein
MPAEYCLEIGCSHFLSIFLYSTSVSIKIFIYQTLIYAFCHSFNETNEAAFYIFFCPYLSLRMCSAASTKQLT